MQSDVSLIDVFEHCAQEISSQLDVIYGENASDIVGLARLSPLHQAFNQATADILFEIKKEIYDDEDRRRFETVFKEITAKHQRIAEAFHEAAHAIIAYNLQLGIRRAEIRIEGTGRAITTLEKHDPARQNLADWARRFVISTNAGVVAESWVTPESIIKGDYGDRENIQSWLNQAGIEHEGTALRKASEQLVLILQPVIWSIARYLLRENQISREKIISIYESNIDDSMRKRCKDCISDLL